jgi:hypothetical protein
MGIATCGAKFFECIVRQYQKTYWSLGDIYGGGDKMNKSLFPD